jgi:hypothetical protein
MYQKIWKFTLLMAVLATTLTAEIVFDLGAQQFYYTEVKATASDGSTYNQYVEASYDVGEVIVSTALTSENGYYRTRLRYEGGYFGVSLKNPKPTTAISFNMYCYFKSGHSCSVELLDENAQALVVAITYGRVNVNGASKSGDFSSGTSISGAIEITSSNVHIDINGKIFDIAKSNFELKKVNLTLDNAGNNKLHSLVVSTAD